MTSWADNVGSSRGDRSAAARRACEHSACGARGQAGAGDASGNNSTGRSTGPDGSAGAELRTA